MGRHRRISGEAGFTVIEVVIAAALLFFVLTAIIGLMGASSNMTVQAKQRAVMTNAVASYLDNLRVTAWEDVVEPDAPIVIVVNGITVTIDMSVELRQEDGQEIAKIIRVTAISTLDGKSQMYETSVSLLKNPNFNRTLQTDPDAPVVFFTADAPDDDGVIWADQSASGPIFLRTKAFSPVAKIKSVRYDITGRETGDPLAVFTPSPMVQTYYSGPTLNTTSLGIGDGFQTVSVAAVDDYERVGTQKRRFIVDNQPPANPGPSTVTSITSTSLLIQWAAATDGGTYDAPNYASHYRCEISVEPSQTQPSWATDRVVLNEPRWLAGNSVPLALTNSGPIIYEATVASSTLDVDLRGVSPFSRFTARVLASSPRGLTTDTWVQSAAPGFTRPELFCGSLASPRRSRVDVTNDTNNPKGSVYDLTLFVSRGGFQRSADNPTWRIQYQSAVPTPTPGGWKDMPTTSTSSIIVQSPMSSGVFDDHSMVLTAKYKFIDFADGRPMWFRVRVSGYITRRAPIQAVPVMYTNAAGPSLPGASAAVRTYLAPDWSF